MIKIVTFPPELRTKNQRIVYLNENSVWGYQDIHLIDSGGRWVSKPNLVFLEQKNGELSRG